MSGRSYVLQRARIPRRYLQKTIHVNRFGYEWAPGIRMDDGRILLGFIVFEYAICAIEENNGGLSRPPSISAGTHEKSVLLIIITKESRDTPRGDGSRSTAGGCGGGGRAAGGEDDEDGRVKGALY